MPSPNLERMARGADRAGGAMDVDAMRKELGISLITNNPSLATPASGKLRTDTMPSWHDIRVILLAERPPLLDVWILGRRI
jgi:hypothetical protein